MEKHQLKLIDSRVKPLQLASDGAAAFDLQASRIFDEHGQAKQIDDDIVIQPGTTRLVGTGIAIYIKRKDRAAMILPRSGRGNKGLVVGNLVGLIDSDYQGELIVSLWNRTSDSEQRVSPLERIAQLVIVPIIQPEFEIVGAFDEKTVRGDGGFGSTGKN